MSIITLRIGKLSNVVTYIKRITLPANKIQFIKSCSMGQIFSEPLEWLTIIRHVSLIDFGWLVGCFGYNGPLRQYFSLYRAVSQREGERGERIDESKNVQTTPPAPAASAIGPCPTVIKIVGRPGTGSLPSTIAPPNHPLFDWKSIILSCKLEKICWLIY